MTNYLIKQFWPVLIILAVVLSLFVTNYTPGTYLTGWDNLHPEFNFGANIKRSIFSVWQEYQGLGLLGGMAHASDLPRQVFLWLSSLIIPKELLRYFYHFLMLFLGTTGVYWFLKKIIFENRTDKIVKTVSLLGSLFYLLNLGTVQYFFVPFEPYSTFFGFFPWEIYGLFRYLRATTAKNLLMLAFINLLAIPQAYVQTLFVVYMIILVSILILVIIRNKTKQSLLESLKILFMILAINTFWLLPNTYFAITNLSITQNAMQNKITTEETFQRNKNRGNLLDFALLREFYYDFFDYDQQTKQFTYLLSAWRQNFSKPLILFLGYVFFAIILLGLFQKNRYRLYLLGIFFFCALFFLSDTAIISLLNDLLRSISILNQLFRNPFTKIIVPTAFIFSVGFALGLERLNAYVTRYTPRLTRLARLTVPLHAILFIALLIYSLPAFQGNFIAPQMRVAIPKDYFELFSYFEKQDKSQRIMNLPQGSFWGWNYWRFGTRGSGFIWYGIEQPIMDRAFDVWSKELENYYWELSYALKKEDQKLFNQILEKYQIGYVLFDKNIVFADNPQSPKAILGQERLLQNNPKLKKVKTFGNLSVFKTQLNISLTTNIALTDRLPNAQQPESFFSYDSAFDRLGYYYNQAQSDFIKTSFIFPFGSLFTNRFQKEHPFTIEEKTDSFLVKKEIPKGKFTLHIPSFIEQESAIPTQILVRRAGNRISVRFVLLTPTISIGNTSIPNTPIPKDIEFILNSPFSETLILDINDKDYFLLANSSEEFYPVGTTYLFNSGLANYLKIYENRPIAINTLPAQNFLSGSICGISKEKPFFNSSGLGDTLILWAKNAAICGNYPNISGFPKDSLVKTSFVYKSSLDERPKYCAFSQTLKSCLNKKDAILSGFSQNPKEFIDYFEVNQDDQIDFQVILEATEDEDKNRLKEIQYKDIALTVYPYLIGATINLEAARDFDSQVELDLPRPTSLTVSIPKMENSFSFVNPLEKNLYKRTALNYDELRSGDFYLEEKSEGEKFLRLRAKNASSYLLLRDYNLNNGFGYLTHIKTRHNKGLSSTINIFTNEDLRNYTYTLTESKKDFTSNFYILPPLYEFDKGIAILLGANSYSSQETINDILDLSLYPFPYKYITNLYLQDKNPQPASPIGWPNTYPLKTNKHNPSQYEIQMQETPRKTLILSQSYHPGWKAYQMANGKWQMANWVRMNFPFLFGEELKEHVLVNNWENGWVLNNRTIEQSNNRTIVIIYLPQYLQYIGFGLLVIPFLLLLKKLR